MIPLIRLNSYFAVLTGLFLIFSTALFHLIESRKVIDLSPSTLASDIHVTGNRARENYEDWKHSGSLIILTTPECANLPASASETDFPLLVRLNRDTFDYSQAKPHGEDIRFSTADGAPLPFQIDEWDAAKGMASIWVRMPVIKGSSRQEIKLHWGNPQAQSESSGVAVFNGSNGYASVFHMDDNLKDENAVVQSINVGTTTTAGMIGKGKHFAGNQGIFCGDQISNYPSGGSAHSTEAWFRAEKPNVTIIGWGNEGGGRGSKVRMQFRSPPHLHIDSDFSDVNGNSALPMSEWIHVAHTYKNGEGRIYINGRLDGVDKPTLNIKRPSRMWIGGWYNNYDFVGDIDEVRISRTARSADWVRLEFENQKPNQTLVGPVVQPGSDFSISESKINVMEGKSITIAAKAGGAQKIYWTVKRDGKETIAAVDCLHFTFEAGRVVGDKTASIQFKAIYPDGVKTKDVCVSVKEYVPEPIFSLKSPAQWNGRNAVELAPTITNLTQMQSKGAGHLNYRWDVKGLAVIKEVAAGKLILKRSQNSGKMTVTLSIDNGGSETIHSASIQVNEPKEDAWVFRTPSKDEKPEENQFFARDDKKEGTLYYNGNLHNEKYHDSMIESANSVFLRLYAGDQLIKTVNQKLTADSSYALSVKLKAGLIRYRIEFGTRNGSRETVLRTVNNIVCGDAYIIDGQSNAEATAWGDGDFPYTSEWIRSFGSTDGNPDGSKLRLWGNAVGRAPGGRLQIGYWGMELARRLVEDQKIPICILNGAVGGTRIDVHQRNPVNEEDASTIYGRLLWRARQARLTHGIRGILWHQGENDQGADGPTGDFGWKTYQQYFVEMSAAWKQNYPNILHYYVFQIWPKSCSMGINGSDNQLREVQRRLAALYSNLSVMSTLGVKPAGECHFPPSGYAHIASLICPVVERYNYGRVFPHSINPPNLLNVYYSSDRKDEIILEFDQAILWSNKLSNQFYLDGLQGKVVSGSAAGNIITLKLTSSVTAKQITYLDSKAWNPDNLLYGLNGIAALTFCGVPIMPASANRVK